mmetsp:Transcript_7964/g.17570  ORF Transcript_7964/g.17570 Transcript_7964/m.17570 type:complete len:204 (-) Transcript_7964:191-802(-)
MPTRSLEQVLLQRCVHAISMEVGTCEDGCYGSSPHIIGTPLTACVSTSSGGLDRVQLMEESHCAMVQPKCEDHTPQLIPGQWVQQIRLSIVVSPTHNNSCHISTLECKCVRVRLSRSDAAANARAARILAQLRLLPRELQIWSRSMRLQMQRGISLILAVPRRSVQSTTVLLWVLVRNVRHLTTTSLLCAARHRSIQSGASNM